MQDSEGKERQNRAANIIIQGVEDYGKNECTLDLARDFLENKFVMARTNMTSMECG